MVRLSRTVSAVQAERPAGATQRRVLGALRHRNYRLFFSGQAISTVGTWMQSIAQSWLALELTHSGLLVGLVLAAQFTPMLVAGPFGGIVADRYPKRRVLLLTQVASMVPAFALFALSAEHAVQFWMVLLAALAVGTINVFDAPARQSFVIEMVGRQDLMNAIALNSSVWNGAAVIGPSLAGVLIAAVGIPLCFLANGVSYAAAILALLLMRNLPSLMGARDGQTVWDRIREGALYARHDPVVLSMLSLVAIFSLFAMNRLTLVPLFADQVLHAGAAGFGFLMGSIGLGAFCGAVLLAVWNRGDGNNQFWVALAWALSLVAFSWSRLFALSAALLFVAGFCQIWFMATANSRIQAATPDRLRGRVMSLYAQALMGVGPFGATQAGALASLFGAPVAMTVGAVIAGLTALGLRVAQPAVFASEPEE